MTKTRKGLDALWYEGFEAGQILNSLNPYPDGSRHADEWDAGWAEGVLKRLGEDYADKPAPRGWHKFLQRLTGHRAA